MNFLHILLVAAVNFAIAALEDVRLPPSITRSLSGVVIYRIEEEINLPCSAIGTPKPTYEWQKNGQALNLNSNNIRRKSEGDIQLISAGAHDEGYYQCIATNQFGSTRSDTIVLRKAFLDNMPTPNIQNRIQDKVVTKGEPFHIAFTPMKSYPAPQYRWASADRIEALDSTSAELTRSKRMQWADNGDLYFSYALPDDELNGRIYKGLTFNPRVDITAGGSYTRVKVLGADVAIRQFKPTLLFASTSVTVGLEGNNVTLRCFFAGYPDPDIRWNYPTFSRLAGRMRRENFDTELKISELKQSDEGNYTCTGSNAMGMVSTTIRLLVQATPTFNSSYPGPRDLNATEGDSVTFHCRPYAKPLPWVVWMINGQPLKPYQLPSRVSISKNQSSLTIRSVCKDCIDRDTFSDLMVIQCNASNEHGYAFRAGYLNVLKRTTVRLTTDKEALIEDTDRRSVRFQCLPSFDPSTSGQVSWYRIFGSQPQYIYPHPPTVLVSGGTLTITAGGNGSAWRKHEGQYKCVADNMYSRAEEVVEIQVKIKNGPEPSILDLWWIFVIVACVFLILILILICCLCIFCNRGNKYDVDGKERKNGNNPEKELIASGFQDYQRGDIEPFKGSQNSLGSSARLFGDEEASEASDHGKFLENSSYHSVSYANTAERKKGRSEYI